MSNAKQGSIFVVVALAACQTNQSGHLSAIHTGSITLAATRGSPVAELRAACGDGALTSAGTSVLRREPYLQQVTASSAMVGWVGTTADALHVTVARPDGTVVADAVASAQQPSLRPAGEHQIWSPIGDLAPGQIYCYVLWRGTEQLTQPTGFRTAPGSDSDAAIRFLALGDSGGGGADQYALLDQMYTVPYDLIVHTGDVAYGNGTLQQLDDNMFGVYGDLLRNVAVFPAAGNHDYDTLRGAPFRDVFALPGDSGEHQYSFDWGRAHFAVLDTEVDIEPQVAWLDADLAASPLPWKIVSLHRPPYSSGTHGSDTRLRALLAPIFARHGVQLVLAGHDHDYERMTPQDGVTYVVTGGGGVGTRGVGVSSFTAFSEDVIHFVYGEIRGNQLALHAIDGAGAEFDEVVLLARR